MSLHGVCTIALTPFTEEGDLDEVSIESLSDFYVELRRGAAGIMTGFAYPHVLVETYRRFAAGEEREAQEYFFRYLPLIRFEAQLGVGGVGIRKEILKLRGAISSSHVRFPAPTLDDRTLGELEDLVEVLGLAD